MVTSPGKTAVIKPEVDKVAVQSFVDFHATFAGATFAAPSP